MPLEKTCGNCVFFNGPTECDIFGFTPSPSEGACTEFGPMGKKPEDDCAHKVYQGACETCEVDGCKKPEEDPPKTCLTCHYFFEAGRACVYSKDGGTTIANPSSGTCPDYRREDPLTERKKKPETTVTDYIAGQRDEARETIARLEAENARLVMENTELRGRLKGIEQAIEDVRQEMGLK